MNNILRFVEDANTIGISGHVRPDGDCCGSCLALYHYIKDNWKEKKVTIYLEEIPESYHYLKGWETVNTEFTTTTNDLFISLDSGDLDRLGEASELFNASNMTINIDHHISNTNFAQKNHVIPDASSTCEVLFELFDVDKINYDVAVALYTGMICDTGVFKYTNTSRRTMEIAGILIEKGVPHNKIIDEGFYQKTYVQTQILGRCLLESVMVLDGKCLFSAATKKMLEFYGATSADLDGVIDQLRETKGVEVAILIYEKEFHQYKVSLRSNGKVNVSKIAVYFGGGGHIKAAGCTMRGSIHDVINSITAHIESQLNQK